MDGRSATDESGDESPPSTVCVPVILLILLASTGCTDGSAPAMTPSASTTSPQAIADAQPALPTTQANGADPSPPATEPSPPPDPDPQPERTRDISFDDLKFDIQKGDAFKRSMLTSKIEALDGKPIRIRGYILPTFLQTGLTQFVLVRDNMSCCFGPGAALYDCVIVEMKPGKSTDYSLYPVAVEGTFSVKEMLDPDGKTVAVFHLDGDLVR